MTHFQELDKPLNFTQLLLMRHTTGLSFLPLNMRAFSTWPAFFSNRGYLSNFQRK